MEVVGGDGSPWSYLAAALFARELREFGALGRGRDWDTHRLAADLPHGSPADWQWLKAPPAEWRPQVRQGGEGVTVTFHTYSALGRETIYRHVDCFAAGGRYTCAARETRIAQGKGGYLL